MKLFRNPPILLMLAFLLFSCSKKNDNPPKTIPPVTTTSGVLLFDTDEDYNTGKSNAPLYTSIYFAKLDGTGLTRVTTPPANYFDFDARFSPDGKQILFIRDDLNDDDRSLYIVDTSGNNLKTITTGNDITNAILSPNSKQLAYIKNFSNKFGADDVYVANADGSNETNITNFSSPHWLRSATEA